MASSFVYFLLFAIAILVVLALNLWQTVQDMEAKLKQEKPDVSTSNDSADDIGKIDQRNVQKLINIISVLEKRWGVPHAVAKEMRTYPNVILFFFPYSHIECFCRNTY